MKVNTNIKIERDGLDGIYITFCDKEHEFMHVNEAKKMHKFLTAFLDKVKKAKVRK